MHVPFCVYTYLSNQMTAFKSKWFVGSSSISNVGSKYKALASDTLILHPPGNVSVQSANKKKTFVVVVLRTRKFVSRSILHFLRKSQTSQNPSSPWLGTVRTDGLQFNVHFVQSILHLQISTFRFLL